MAGRSPRRARLSTGKVLVPQFSFAALRARYEKLFAVERPAVVEVVSWAAGNGDRSENGDYIYGKQKLRAIDRELGQLSKKMKFAHVLEPADQQDRSRVFFGATVTIADADDLERVVTLVGDDEAEAGDGRIGWNSPPPTATPPSIATTCCTWCAATPWWMSFESRDVAPRSRRGY